MPQLISVAFIFISVHLLAQAPNTLWTQTYGGSGGDIGYDVRQTGDGGFIIVGNSDSFLADSLDIYLIRTDENGQLLWTKLFGGPDLDFGFAVVETDDGGFAIAGETRSFGAGSGDAWLIRTDSLGNTLWTRTIGGGGHDGAKSLQKTADGGFILTGFTYSSGAGGGDLWLVRTDSLGNTLWERTHGGPQYEIGHSVQQTSDGGFIIAGDQSVPNQGLDLWLIRTDSQGDIAWSLTRDADNYGDQGRSVQQTSDGGFIVTGDFFMEPPGFNFVRLMRVDPDGMVLWENIYDESFGHAVIETHDGGFLLAGASRTNWDLLLIRTDSQGNSLWTLNFGGTFDQEDGYALQQTADGGYIVAGRKRVGSAHDVYLVRLEADVPTAINDGGNGAPGDFYLAQNYPNPFNPETRIRYQISDIKYQNENTGYVNLTVYDLVGRKVRTLVKKQQSAGNYSVSWDGRDDHGQEVSSGIYLYRLQSGRRAITRKMLLVR